MSPAVKLPDFRWTPSPPCSLLVDSIVRGQVDRLSLLGQARLPRPGVHSRGRQVSTLPDSPTWMGRGSEVTGGGTRPPLRREACLACEIGGASCALCAGALP